MDLTANEPPLDQLEHVNRRQIVKAVTALETLLLEAARKREQCRVTVHVPMNRGKFGDVRGSIERVL